MVPMPMMPLGLTIWAIVRADEKDDRGESKDRYAMRRGKHSKYGAMGEVKMKSCVGAMASPVQASIHDSEH